MSEEQHANHKANMKKARTEQGQQVKALFQEMKTKKDKDLQPWEAYIKQERRKTKRLLNKIKEHEFLTDFETNFKEEGNTWQN